MEHPVLTAPRFKPDSQKIETYMADGGYETAQSSDVDGARSHS